MSSSESPMGGPASLTAIRSVPHPDHPGLAVAAVARRLGVAPSTLRTWDRRYGLGPSEHSAGSHRRYSADDVARLLVMRQLTLTGVAPGDAARAARETDPGLVPGDGQPRGSARTQDEQATPTQLVEAALRDDELGCRRLLSAPTRDVETWWTDLVVPARASLATRTVLGQPGEDPEWVLEAATLAVLRTRAAPDDGRVAQGDRGADRARGAGARVVLLFATARERRPLALHVLAAALADRGVDARVVTGPVERHRIVELVAMTRPVAVVVVSELAAPDLAIVAEMSAAAPDLHVFVGLAADDAASGLALGRTIHRERSFLGLLHEVLAVSATK